MNLTTFNRLLEDVADGLEGRRDARDLFFPESLWRAIPDEPLEIPLELELDSENGTVAGVVMTAERATTHALLRLVESLERTSRAEDPLPDTRHIFFEGITPVHSDAPRYVTCWGS